MTVTNIVNEPGPTVPAKGSALTSRFTEQVAQGGWVFDLVGWLFIVKKRTTGWYLYALFNQSTQALLLLG